MAMGADYSFELIFNETCAPQFIGHNKSFLGSVVKQFYSGPKICGMRGLRVSNWDVFFKRRKRSSKQARQAIDNFDPAA